MNGKGGKDMLVYELRLRVFLKADIEYFCAGERIGQLLNRAMGRDPQYLDFHERPKEYKGYVFDAFYPFEKDGVYRAGKTYGVRLRTVRENLAEFFLENLTGEETAHVRCMKVDIRIIPRKGIQKLYSLTPAVMKNYPQGYWRDNMTVAQFEKRLTDNLMKKYKQLTGTELDEDLMLYNGVKFINGKPVKVSYKGITLLGDKVELLAANEEMAQKLLYMALGTGILENNGACGCGFVDFL